MSPHKETRARGCSIRHMQMRSTIAARSSLRVSLGSFFGRTDQISNHPFPNYQGIPVRARLTGSARRRRLSLGPAAAQGDREGLDAAMVYAVLSRNILKAHSPGSLPSHRNHPAGSTRQERRQAGKSRSKSQIPTRYRKNRYLISAAAPRISTTTTSSKMADSSQFQTI
jgi:hypothetical protein